MPEVEEAAAKLYVDLLVETRDRMAPPLVAINDARQRHGLPPRDEFIGMQTREWR